MEQKIITLTLLMLMFGCSSFDWEPHWWAFNAETKSIIGEDGQVVSCGQPEIEEYLALHYTNIEELLAEIEEMNISDERKGDLRSLILSRMVYVKEGSTE